MVVGLVILEPAEPEPNQATGDLFPPRALRAARSAEGVAGQGVAVNAATMTLRTSAAAHVLHLTLLTEDLPLLAIAGARLAVLASPGVAHAIPASGCG